MKSIGDKLAILHEKSIRALMEAERELGKLDEYIRRIENVKPAIIVPQLHPGSVEIKIGNYDSKLYVFRELDLQLAGVNTSKWERATQYVESAKQWKQLTERERADIQEQHPNENHAGERWYRTTMGIWAIGT